jgi:hypothetical protein
MDKQQNKVSDSSTSHAIKTSKRPQSKKDKEHARRLFNSWYKEKFFISPLVTAESFTNYSDEKVYLLQYKALFEKRWEKSVTEPYTGVFEPNSKYKNLQDIPTQEPTEYREITWSSVKEGSESVSVCKKCKGAGKVFCHTCDGTGRVEKEYKDAEGQWRTRFDDCKTCRGTGKLNCPICKSYGRVITYTKGFVGWEILEKEHFVREVPIPYNQLLQVAATSTKEFENAVQQLPDSLPENVQNTLKEIIKSVKSSSENGRILRDTLKVSTYSLIKVEYSVEDKTYAVFFFGNGLSYSINYPLNKKLIAWMSVVGVEVLILLFLLASLLSRG